jgi:hypothetical protein
MVRNFLVCGKRCATTLRNIRSVRPGGFRGDLALFGFEGSHRRNTLIKPELRSPALSFFPPRPSRQSFHSNQREAAVSASANACVPAPTTPE